jgi:cytochrome c553
MTTSSRLIVVIWTCCSAVSAPSISIAATPEPTAEQVKFFEEKVRPILAENCYKCHGEEKQKGSLRLDLRETVLAGGENGPVVVAGKPDESTLVEAVKWQSFEMPPTGKLSEEQIATLAEWVRIGAPMPKDHGGGGGVALRKTRGAITNEDRQWWAFQPVRRPALPVAPDPGSTTPNGVDSFIDAKLSENGLDAAPEADRRTLIRRLTLDLTGLPPTPDEVDDFLEAERPDAYECLVDRLLASPHHGEHWARHWLDLVRYAESDGYKQDAYREAAYHYRDYIIRSFNRDKPYSQFVLEQLAGDEACGSDPDALIATMYLRLGIYEYNQRDVRNQWSIILNDLTDVTADVMLGMGMSCARCHDHKFDPILQKDYYRLQAFFAPILWRENVVAAKAEEVAEYHRQLAVWEEATAEVRRQVAEIEDPIRQAAMRTTMVKFTDDLLDMVNKPANERTPDEAQLAYLIEYQVSDGEGKADIGAKLKGEKKELWQQLTQELAKFDHLRPTPIPFVPSVTDVGPISPKVVIPGRRDGENVEPGPLAVLEPAGGGIEPPGNETSLAVNHYRKANASPSPTSTGRRTALAQWIASRDNPLPSRVLVNRLWQQHFGRGLAESPSDFGRLGQPPSHPELLDWLASELLDNDWSMKRLHRLMVTSVAYRRASHGPEVEEVAVKDPTNKWLARMPIRRLAAEQVRDAAEAVTGELDSAVGGQSGDWSKSRRRAVYLKVLRNKSEPVLDVFDAPDGIFTTPVRNVTTTPTQSLFLINGPWMMTRAKAFSKRLSADSSATLEQRIVTAYSLAFGRIPTESETNEAIRFLQTNAGKGDDAFVDFCHVLLNSSEFLYVD